MLHHILDPRTSLPAEPVWRTVSVAAGTCADANAASTAAVIRGHRALGWLAQLGLPARLVDATGVVFTVAGWPDERHPDERHPDERHPDESHPDELNDEPNAREQSEAVQK